MPQLFSPLYAGQDSSDVISRTPSILQYVQAEFSRGVDVRVEHLADKLDSRWLIRVCFLEVHDQSERSVFEWCVGGPDYDSIPVQTHELFPLQFLLVLGLHTMS
jgi:hypothetical protein